MNNWNLPFLSGRFFGASCPNFDCWAKAFLLWVSTLMIPVGTLMLIAAGVIIMTSNGNPSRIALGKNIITGVMSGFFLILMASFIVYSFLGLPAGWVGGL